MTLPQLEGARVMSNGTVEVDSGATLLLEFAQTSTNWNRDTGA
jgi:hypothetical protein